MKLNLVILVTALLISFGCETKKVIESIELTKEWQFAPDESNVGVDAKWYDANFDDSKWEVIEAGEKWEKQGYENLDASGWYRKSVDIPSNWKGNDVWIKFGGVNDAYTIFVNGEKIGYFGEANISVAAKATFSKITKALKYGTSNQITLKVDDWGGSGGLWRLPIVVTTDESEVNNLFRPISKTKFKPENSGYELYWEDEFEGNQLDATKWAVRGVGPRAAGFVSPDAVKVKDGFLELAAFEENDSIKVGAVGTYGKFMTTYGYFECRAQLHKSKGNWSAFWMQSPDIAKGEDPGKFGTEIDIFEYFKKLGGNIISHNLHWAYGPNQQSIGGLQSQVDGISEGFHTFAAEWTPEKYVFFIDGFKYYEVTRAISNIDQYIILSMELPSTREGLKDATLPDVFKVDYVKVYKKKQK